MVGELARHEVTAAACLAIEPCRHLVSLLHDENPRVVASAAQALCRIGGSSEGAEAAAGANVLDWVAELLRSPHTEIRATTCGLLGELAGHEATLPAVLSSQPCERLVFLLRDPEIEVTECAAYALYKFAVSPEGAQAAIDTNVLDGVVGMLTSNSPIVRRWTCELLGKLASHHSTAPAVLIAEPCKRLVLLLDDGSFDVIGSAAYALSSIAKSPEGAQAAVNAQVLDRTTELLGAPNTLVRRWTCETVGNLAQHKSIASAVMDVNPCHKLVSLLRDEDADVIRSAAHALSMIAQFPEGAQAAVEGNVLDSMVELLDSPETKFQEWTCSMLSQLVSHRTTAAAVLTMMPCEHLVASLSQYTYTATLGLWSPENGDVVAWMVYALHKIALSPEGAEAALEANVLEYATDLLQLPEPRVREWTANMLGQLVGHETASAAVLGMNPCHQLASLLRDENRDVIESAAYALYRIAKSSQGAQSVVDANVLDYVPELLKSRSVWVRILTCKILGDLARHHSTAADVLGINPCAQLVSILRDQNLSVVESAAYALCWIAKWPGESHTVVALNALHSMAALLQSPDDAVRMWTCKMVGHMAGYKSTLIAVLRTSPIMVMQLTSLCRYTDTYVRANAVFALAKISESREGVATLAATIPHVSVLMDSQNREVNLHTCRLLRNLARYQSRQRVASPAS
ncbi:armadillo-type protein [Mycena vulgaris]|nr:armadillo-type protein [Mycena vulgaris]